MLSSAQSPKDASERVKQSFSVKISMCSKTRTYKEVSLCVSTDLVTFPSRKMNSDIIFANLPGTGDNEKKLQPCKVKLMLKDVMNVGRQ